MARLTGKTLAIDIGGTGVKMIALDLSGQPVTERTRVPTPQPATPKAVVDALNGMDESHKPYKRISVGFPGVVVDGVVKSAANLDKSWIGFNLQASLEKQLGTPTRVANDADVQGFGAIEGKGVELVITLGTGLGSAIFVDGHLVPNLELGHHPFLKEKTYEQHLGKAALAKSGKKKWNKRVGAAIKQLAHTFNYTKLYIGGGNAKKVTIDLPDNVQLVANVAGLLGGIALWKDGHI
jgi:polyphosphate glucokinase